MNTGPVSRRVVNAQVARVTASLRRLEQLTALSQGEFLAASDNFAIAEHHLRIALEAALDAGRHLVARLRLGTAADYADVPRLLRDAQVVSPATGDCMARCARLRNRLVRMYWQVDAAELFSRLPDAIACLGDFCAEVAAFMDTRSEPPTAED